MIPQGLMWATLPRAFTSRVSEKEALRGNAGLQVGDKIMQVTSVEKRKTGLVLEDVKPLGVVGLPLPTSLGTWETHQ